MPSRCACAVPGSASRRARCFPPEVGVCRVRTLRPRRMGARTSRCIDNTVAAGVSIGGAIFRATSAIPCQWRHLPHPFAQYPLDLLFRDPGLPAVTDVPYEAGLDPPVDRPDQLLDYGGHLVRPEIPLVGNAYQGNLPLSKINQRTIFQIALALSDFLLINIPGGHRTPGHSPLKGGGVSVRGDPDSGPDTVSAPAYAFKLDT